MLPLVFTFYYFDGVKIPSVITVASFITQTAPSLNLKKGQTIRVISQHDKSNLSD